MEKIPQPGSENHTIQINSMNSQHKTPGQKESHKDAAEILYFTRCIYVRVTLSDSQ